MDTTKRHAGRPELEPGELRSVVIKVRITAAGADALAEYCRRAGVVRATSARNALDEMLRDEGLLMGGDDGRSNQHETRSGDAPEE